jgi:uncharacterized membrane protein
MTTRIRRLLIAAAVVAGALLAGCEEPVNCATAPVVTFSNFGEGFVTFHCQGCHSSTAQDRNGAPESITFDNADEVWSLSDLVLDVAASPEPLMPPRGGVTEEDRELLRVWLTCTEVGN